MAKELILIPAYGRAYETKEQALADWKAGKDFKIVNGPYCSIRDVSHLIRLHEQVFIRYGLLRVMLKI